MRIARFCSRRAPNVADAAASVNDSKWARGNGHSRTRVHDGAYCRDCTELRNFLRLMRQRQRQRRVPASRG